MGIRGSYTVHVVVSVVCSELKAQNTEMATMLLRQEEDKFLPLSAS